MILQYASDLHLEFPANREFLKRHPLQPVCDVLVLAGDIVPFAVMDEHAGFFSYLADHFDSAYWVPGNHEYYRFDVAKKSGVLLEKIRSNVILVNNASVVHDNVRLIFSTLWSKISPDNQWYIERSMNDFHLIQYKGYRLSVGPYNNLHEECIDFIHSELKTVQAEKTAVITHHCPTFLNYPEQYKGNALNEGFAVELHDLIEAYGISCWAFGHHHSNIPEFKIGNTSLVTNQLGYVHLNEHVLFDTGKSIEL